MLQLDPDVVALVAVGAAVLAFVSIVLLLVVAGRLRQLRRSFRRVFQHADDDVLGLLRRHEDDLTVLRRGVDGAVSTADDLVRRLEDTISRVGIVRYDAFDDMGGALSFSAALLDGRGDGIVLSAINGRTETRSYGKPVVGGSSEHHLTEEERAAIAAAIEGRSPHVLPEGGRRRRRPGA